MNKFGLFLTVWSLALGTSCIKANARRPQNLATNYFEAIKNHIVNYKRPITILDLNPQGFFPFLLAKLYKNSVYVMVSPDHDNYLFNQCKSYNNIVLLKHELTQQELMRFCECEHFDIVIACGIAENLDEHWQEFLDGILGLGDYIFIDTPYKFHKNYLLSKKTALVAYTNKTQLFMTYMNKTHLLRRRWNYQKQCKIGEYTIESTFTSKKLFKNKPGKTPKVTDWYPGLNLLTYRILHGVYPTKAKVVAMIMDMKDIMHNDLRIFNFILQGTRLQPIDSNEEGLGIHDRGEEMRHILNYFKNTYSQNSEHMNRLLFKIFFESNLAGEESDDDNDL